MSDGIISYAQNFEDVILWRALSHVGKGNYIDIGAQSAFEDSVSRAFHEHGWKGVHVEPVPFYADQLRNQRPGDTVVQAMVGAEEGVGELFAMSGTGLSTSREDLAEGYQRDGREVVRELVPVVTLDRILDKVDGDIHWLKIDVEGAEQQVLEGWHGALRPWVVVVESTRPMSQEQSHDEWDSLVTGKGYRFVYFDGLNRFYVHESHATLEAAFGVGPNVFDRFALSGTATSTFSAKLNRDLAQVREELAHVSAECDRERNGREQSQQELLQHRAASGARETALLADQAHAWRRANELQVELEQARRHALEAVAAAVATLEQDRIAAVTALEQQRDDAIERASRLHADLMVIHRSTSWIVTAPLRAVSRIARWTLKAPVVAVRSFVPWTKQTIKRVAFGLARRGARSPFLRRVARRAFITVPGLERRVRAVYSAATRPAVALQPALAVTEHSILLQVLSEPLPEGISAQAKQSLLRLRHAAVGVKS